MEQDALLEEHLEKLFSDVLLPQSTVATKQPLLHPATQVKPNWLNKMGRLAGSLGTLAIFGWVLVIAFTLVEPGGVIEYEATAPPGAIALAVNPTATASPSAVTLTERAPSPTPLPATHTPTQPSPTAVPPTAVPATPTPTEPVATATATLAQVQHVSSATTTPVPADAIGLEAIPTPVSRVPMSDNAINIVLLGSDQRPDETQWRTDVVIIVSVNPDLPSVSMLSIPRDTWLYIPNWTYQRINLADVHGALVGYPGGGPGLVKATIEYNFGIHVDYFARVNFAGLMRIVDTLGGIDVLLECPVEDGFPDDPITEDPSLVTQMSYPEPGLYHVDGKHALWLSRSRKTTSEFARSRRQHRVLMAIWHKSNQLGLIAQLPELWEDLTSTVETDLSLDQVLWLASVGLKLNSSQIHSGFLDGRHLTAWVSPGGANVLLPNTEEILKELEALFNPYPYQAPQGFSQVEVWNASGHEDWGILAADKLLRNGFEVTGIHQSDELYEKSVILDLTPSTKGSPLPLLQRLFNAEIAHAPSEGDGDVPFRLIVGADYQPCQRPTPAQWQPTPTPSAPSPEG